MYKKIKSFVCKVPPPVEDFIKKQKGLQSTRSTCRDYEVFVLTECSINLRISLQEHTACYRLKVWFISYQQCDHWNLGTLKNLEILFWQTVL